MIQIDIEKTYMLGEFEYVNYTQLTYEQKCQVLEWRNREEVRKWMYTKDPIPLETHLNFIQNLNYKNDTFYWLVFKEGKPVGNFCLTDVDYETSSTECGIDFIDTTPLGLESNWNCFVNTIEFTFSLGFAKIYAHTARNNKYVIMMNTCVGYVDNSADGEYTNHCLTNECFKQRLTEGLSYKDFRKFSKQYIRQQISNN